MFSRLSNFLFSGLEFMCFTVLKLIAMKKSEAIKLFSRAYKLAEAVGVTPGAVSQWPEELPQQKVDMIVGAAVRLGKLKPEDVGTFGCDGNRQNA
jgi:hypothetical protein